MKIHFKVLTKVFYIQKEFAVDYVKIIGLHIVHI